VAKFKPVAIKDSIQRVNKSETAEHTIPLLDTLGKLWFNYDRFSFTPDEAV